MSENTQTTQVTIQDVALSREWIAAQKKRISAIEEAIAQSADGLLLAELRGLLAVDQKQAEEVEAAYRAQCVAAYQATGEKQQPGGQVKLYKSLTYDPGLAVEWSLKHGHAQLLKLNATAFEKVAKELALEFVEATEEPRMTLASDLSEWLEGEA